MTAAERRDAATREIEKSLRAGRLHFRARLEIETALREVVERRGDPAGRLDRCAHYVSPVIAGYLAVASGHLRRIGAGR